MKTKYDYLIGKVFEARDGLEQASYFQVEHINMDRYPRLYYRTLGENGTIGSMPISTLLAPVNSKLYREVKYD